MQHVLADCDKKFASGNRRSGKYSVRVCCWVSLLVVAMECGVGVVRAYRGMNEGVAIECGP